MAKKKTETVSVNDIENITVILRSKDGKGYAGNIDVAFISLIAHMAKFVEVDNVMLIDLKSIAKK